MNKKQLIIFTIPCIMLFSFDTLNAQSDSDNRYKKNAIHGSLGTVLIVNTANVFYERILSESTKSRFTTFARIDLHESYGTNVLGLNAGLIAQGAILTDRNRSHFEGAPGVVSMTLFDQLIP